MSAKHTITLALALFLSLSVLAGVAEAGKGAVHANKPVAGTGSVSLVLLDSTDGQPHYGQHVTFNVTSTAAYPVVTLTCYQNGDWVTNQTVGFYVGWPWSQVFPLSSMKWPGGAADCNAVLSYQTTKGSVTLATTSFHVYE